MDDPAASLQSAMAFPVTASMGPAGPLLLQLSSLTSTQEGTSKDEIQRFTKDLGDLCVSLMHQAEVEEPLSSTAKCWMSEVRELFCDTKNFLDDSLTSKQKKNIVRSKFKVLEARAEHAKERCKGTEIYKQSIRKPPKLPSTGRRLPVLHPELIDRGRMDRLAALLGNAQEKELKVVSLVGLEGVGKTTLARRLYHKTGGQFQCRAFVRVSPNTDMRRLLTTIYTQIQSPPVFSSSSSEGTVSQPACCLDAQALITNIKDYLQDKRYFIIIDDLWSTSVWDVIRRAFPGGVFRSRIITTTRVDEVASACCSYQSKNIFQMEPLKYEQSRKLFFSMVFGSVDKVRIPDGIGEVIYEIIEKCGGLPLSVINIASLLPTEESEINLKQWMDIRDSLLCMRRNPTSRGIMEILNLIYNNLSPELKTCLLYLVVYPEGYTVNKDDLVKQWVIEGLIGEGENKEELAGRYFDELVSRGMIQAVDINHCGVLSCTLHHTVHDIIVNKSMEENFIISVDYFQSAIGLLHKVRRLTVQFGAERSARKPEGIMMSEVQSLAFFGFYGCTDFIEECKLLRFLILHVWADQDKVPFDLSAICNLLQLRYLKVACNIAVRLPRKIQNLKLLETLEVDTPLVAIPSHIGGLSRLSSLKIAVTVLSRQDIRILQKMAALTALSLDVKTAPTEWIVFGKGGFLVLKFFTFSSSAPRLIIEESAMPKIEKLNLHFNAHEACQDGKKPITIEHLASLKEFTLKIWVAVADKGSAWTNAVTNDARNINPIVEFMEAKEDGEQGIQEQQDYCLGEYESDEDYYSEIYETEEACSRMLSNLTDPGSPIEAIPFTMEMLYLKVGLNSTCDLYTEFIKEFRRKIAEHQGKAVVDDYGPVLARKQQHGKQVRIMLVNLFEHPDPKERVSLAVRDDNLELVGFKIGDGVWYEFGIECESTQLLKDSKFVGCEGSYVSLIGEAEDVLQKLELGRMSAKTAIDVLSKYQHSVGFHENTKKALACLKVMICESARFAPIYDTVKTGWEMENGISITERQVKYIHNWANISHFLLDRRSDAGIDDEADAVSALHLVHNPARPLVELFGMRAAYGFRATISIVDEENPKVIICKCYGGGQLNYVDAGIHGQSDYIGARGRGRSRGRYDYEDYMIDVPLNATYRPVPSDGKMHIQVDNIIPERDSFMQPMTVVSMIKHRIKIYNPCFEAELKYGVHHDAVVKCLKVQLHLKEHKAHHVVSLHGEITVTNKAFVGRRVLLSHRTEKRAIQCDVTHTSDGLGVISVPLVRDFVAAPLYETLDIKVRLYARPLGYQNPISLDGTLHFDHNTNSETKNIGQPGISEAHLMVTATVQETKLDIIARENKARKIRDKATASTPLLDEVKTKKSSV